MSILILNQRRRRLGLSIRQLVKLSGIPTATVNRILSDPSKVRFAHVAAVASVMGIDFVAGKKTPITKLLQERATAKARYVARLVQGTQALEAAAVDSAGYQRLIEVSTAALLAGKKRKLWEDD